MFKPRGLLFVGLLLLSAPAAYAAPISFETDFASEGWTTIGNVTRVGGGVELPLEVGTFITPTPGVTPIPGYDPPQYYGEGAMQALLGTSSPAVAVEQIDDFFGLALGTIRNLPFTNGAPEANGGYTRGSAIKREFVLGAGDTVTFDWAFIAGDGVPSCSDPGADPNNCGPDAQYNDAAFFVMNQETQQLVQLSSVYEAGGSIGKTKIERFHADQGGTYILGVGIFDKTDESFPSYLTVDNFVINQATGESGGPTPVPEPTTLLLLTGGFAAVFGARRHRTI